MAQKLGRAMTGREAATLVFRLVALYALLGALGGALPYFCWAVYHLVSSTPPRSAYSSTVTLVHWLVLFPAALTAAVIAWRWAEWLGRRVTQDKGEASASLLSPAQVLGAIALSSVGLYILLGWVLRAAGFGASVTARVESGDAGLYGFVIAKGLGLGFDLAIGTLLLFGSRRLVILFPGFPRTRAEESSDAFAEGSDMTAEKRQTPTQGEG